MRGEVGNRVGKKGREGEQGGEQDLPETLGGRKALAGSEEMSQLM